VCGVYIGGMNTDQPIRTLDELTADNDKFYSDRERLRTRARFLLWLVECMSPPRWERMSDEGRAAIRAEATRALKETQ